MLKNKIVLWSQIWNYDFYFTYTQKQETHALNKNTLIKETSNTPTNKKKKHALNKKETYAWNKWNEKHNTRIKKKKHTHDTKQNTEDSIKKSRTK